MGDLYPGAPMERKFFATLLLKSLLEMWSYNGDLNPGRLQRKESRNRSSIGGLESVALDLAQPTSSLAILGKDALEHFKVLQQRDDNNRARDGLAALLLADAEQSIIPSPNVLSLYLSF